MDKMQVYGGPVTMGIKKVKSIEKGDSSNVFRFTMEDHWGTHVDLPNHFFDKGDRIINYRPDFWFFKSPQVVQAPLSKGEILEWGVWARGIDRKTDILLIKTGWGEFRGKNVYGRVNPGVHPDVGFNLRRHYPRLRAVGIDLPSISSYLNRGLGRQAHKAFLDPEGRNNPILIIEDINLSGTLKSLREVFIAPLLITGVDSAPCTVVGAFS